MASPPVTQLRDLVVSSAWRQNDTLGEFASILREHDAGFFYRSACAVDELFTDDRIQGVSETRVGELLSSPLKFVPPSDKGKAIRLAEEIGGKKLDGVGGLWDSICSAATVATMEKWGIFLGFAIAEIVWNRTPQKWTPRLVPWHPANVWWDQWKQRFILNTMTGPVVLPRPDEQPEGDGKWVVWCPNGVQYGWREGLIRSLGEVYLSRRYSKRDLSRWCETRALGILKGMVPQGATDAEKDNFRADLANAHSETVVIVPQGTKDTPGYDVDGVNLGESGGTSWQGIKGSIDDANTDISVLILGGNLPTEQKGDGSYASSKVQKQTSVNRALRDATVGPVIGRQVLTHFADANYGDASLAPAPCYEVTPEEDELHEAQAEVAEAQALKTKAEAIQLLLNLDPHVDVETMLESEGVPLLSEDELAARMEEEAQRAADAMAMQPQQQPAPTDPAAQPAEGDTAAVGDQKQQQGLSRAALGTLENVRKRYSYQGLDVAVENPAQTIRRWTDATGRSGHTVMRHDYGFLDGYLGSDKEELDCYIGPDETAEHVFVIKQHGPVGMDGRWCFDEDKVMLGFPTAEAAKAAFLAHRDDGEKAFGGMVMHTMATFRAKLSRRRRDSTAPIRASIDATGRSLMALAMRARQGSAATTVAGRKRAAKYQEALLENSKRRAAAAIAPFLVGMRVEIERAGSLEAVKPRLLKYLAEQKKPRALALVVQGMNVLSGMHGRATAREGI